MVCFRIILLALSVLYVRGDAEADLKYLAHIFPGFYDNIVQYKNDIKYRVPLPDRHDHLSMRVSSQDIGILEGQANFYLEEYTNGNPNNLVRQRIYSYGIDEEQEIQLKFYSLVDEDKFAHCKPHSPLFKNLTMKDVIYIEGCDVYWDRVNEELLRSHMFNTCIVPYNGTKIVITDTNDLSPFYLTVKETWFNANTGTVVRSTPVPYNLTKQQENLNKRISRKQLKSFNDILQALQSGQAVRYHVTAAYCKNTGSQLPPETLQGDITSFNFFSHRTDDPHITFVTSSDNGDFSGNRRQLNSGIIFKSGALKLTLRTTTTEQGMTRLDCGFGTDTISEAVIFSVASHTFLDEDFRSVGTSLKDEVVDETIG